MNNPLVRSPCQFQAQMNTINMFNIAVVMPVQAELFAAREAEALAAAGVKKADIEKAQAFALERAVAETEKATYQAMEALVHNLNTMHSRAGAQIPFSSINYGTDTSSEGRMLIRNLLLATEAGLGNGETPIFPIQIFKVKEGVNFNEGDPNYDLFKMACRCSAKRLFPNFSFIDAPFNKQYYREGRPETEIAYMGCRTRVIGNTFDPEHEIVTGRGNLSFTSVNLPRLAIKSKGNVELFFEQLDHVIDVVIAQLLERYSIQAKKKVKNYPFLMGQGVWLGSENLSPEDTVGEVLKQGTLTCGFIGLAETLKSLIGKHHGESEEAQNLGLEIVGHMRKRMDEGKHLKLEVTTAAKDFIIDSAYDSVYGARPIKRFIQSRVETLIAKAIIQGSYTEGNTLTVDCENGALTLR